MKEGTMTAGLLFVLSIVTFVGAAYLYFQKETSDYAKAADFTSEARKFSEASAERADAAIKASNETQDAVLTIEERFDKLSERVDKLVRGAPTMNVNLTQPARPILVEVVERKPSKLVPEAARKAKETMQRSRLSN